MQTAWRSQKEWEMGTASSPSAGASRKFCLPWHPIWHWWQAALSQHAGSHSDSCQSTYAETQHSSKLAGQFLYLARILHSLADIPRILFQYVLANDGQPLPNSFMIFYQRYLQWSSCLLLQSVPGRPFLILGRTRFAHITSLRLARHLNCKTPALYTLTNDWQPLPTSRMFFANGQQV